MNKKNYILQAKKSADIQISELKKVKKIFNKSFVRAVDLILNCKGKVIFAGIGKSGFDKAAESANNSSLWWEYNISETFIKMLPTNLSASIGIAQLDKIDNLQNRRKEICGIIT